MGRAPCCDKANVKKGPWSPEEDAKLMEYIDKNGTVGNWIALPQKAGLKRCGKSCRLRWLNYLRPNIKHGDFTEAEDRTICGLFASIGSRWSIIAAHLPGRTDNDIKNYWNTKLKKKLRGLVSPNNQRTPSIPPFQTRQFSQCPPVQFTSSPLHKCCSSAYYHYNKTKPLTGLEPIHMNNSDNSSSMEYSLVQEQEENLMRSIQDYHYFPVNYKESSSCNNFLMFGNEGRCSSDGSCGQISYGKDIKQYIMQGGGRICLSSSNGFEQNQKLTFDYNGDRSCNNVSVCYDHLSTSSRIDQKPDVHFGSNSSSSVVQQRHDIDEVKQLINSSNEFDYSFSFFNDENNTHERTLYNW